MSIRSNSITTYIDEHSIATRVRQLRSEHRRRSQVPIAIVLVEGEIVDPWVYSHLFNIKFCHVEPSFGKSNAINAIALLTGDNYLGVFAIVDDDFDSLNGVKIQTEHIISTDTHDIENLILVSPALEKYLLFLLPRENQKFQASFADAVRDAIVKIGRPLGLMRWYFNRNMKPVDFKNLNFENFIDPRLRNIQLTVAIQELLQKNNRIDIQDTELLNHVQANLNQYDWWLICQGHDLVKILLLLLPVMLSELAPKDPTGRNKFFQDTYSMISTEKNIVKNLAMCYEKSYFEKTRMYVWILDWEKRNPAYSILS